MAQLISRNYHFAVTLTVQAQRRAIVGRLVITKPSTDTEWDISLEESRPKASDTQTQWVQVQRIFGLAA